MAASKNDKLMKVGLATATNLDANYTAGATSLTVVSTSGMPTDTGITVAIDTIDSAGVQVPGSYNEYVCTVASATGLANVEWADGSGDTNYNAGATTRVYIPVAKTRENRIVEWGVAEHKQDGTHADIITTNTINENTPANGVTIDGLNIKDSAITTANSVPNSAIQDTAVTPAKLLAGTGTTWAWQSWTPTWTDLTVGNGTVVAKYSQVGKIVTATISLLFGSTTSISSNPTFSLPVTAATRYTGSSVGAPMIGTIYIEDAAINGYSGFVQARTTTSAAFVIIGTSGAYSLNVGIGSTVPFTWGTSDFITGTFTYEAA